MMELDVMMAKRKMKSKDLAQLIGITETNLSILKNGKGKGIRWEILAKLCKILECQPGDIIKYVPACRDQVV